MYVPRFIEATVALRLTESPVVVIEGARSVGKTRLLARLLELGTINRSVSLTDPTARAAAVSSPSSWLRSLGSSFAIDEAQLVDGLPLAIKQLLDSTDETIRCVLTCSASIGRSGLGGSDPLARRTARLTLEPLSEAELRLPGKRWSLVDQLFDGEPEGGLVAETDWPSALRRGGLPRYRLQSAATLPGQILGDLDSILTDDVLPGERFDRRIASDVVRLVLRKPAGELNVAAMASELRIDARTVGRYLDVLERRFLITELPNLRQPIKRSARSTAKAFPADVALSWAVARAGDRGIADDQLRGGLVEAHVAQQLRAHLGWTESAPGLFHWRELRSGRYDEVDLVMSDGQERLVALEVKARDHAQPQDFAGIRALLDQYGDRFRRGFVVTTGGSAVSFADDLWAIPLDALADPAWWGLAGESAAAPNTALRSGPAPAEMLTFQPNAVAQARIFMSYAHADQSSAVGGDLRQFVRDVVDALEGVFDRRVTAFIDIDDGQWGELLWDRIDAGLQASTFLLPLVTPRYLTSDSCRTEFTRFLDAAERNGAGQLVLPLVWIKPPALSGPISSDIVLERIRKTRHLDVSAARRADRTSAQYRDLVEEVAAALNDILTTREDATIEPSAEADEGEPALVDDADRLIEIVAELIPAAQRFTTSLAAVGEAFERESASLRTNNPEQAQVALLGLGRLMTGRNASLVEASEVLSRQWSSFMTSANRVALAGSALGVRMPAEVVAGVEQLATLFETLDTAELEVIAQQMPRLSSGLTPTSRALMAAIRTVRTMATTSREWVVEHS